jgi:NADH-quinone oxidoreductase subunit C
MALVPAVTDIEQLKEQPALAKLLAWNVSAVTAAKLDRGELTIVVQAGMIREACSVLRDNAQFPFNFLEDVTCVDWYPSEPRFEVVYHLLSITKKARVRLKAKVGSDDLSLPSVTSVWGSANFFEREVFDLFGIRFEGHPYLRRIMMPEDWEGHPLRKDYPVEGYR